LHFFSTENIAKVQIPINLQKQLKFINGIKFKGFTRITA